MNKSFIKEIKLFQGKTNEELESYCSDNFDLNDLLPQEEKVDQFYKAFNEFYRLEIEISRHTSEAGNRGGEHLSETIDKALTYFKEANIQIKSLYINDTTGVCAYKILIQGIKLIKIIIQYDDSVTVELKKSFMELYSEIWNFEIRLQNFKLKPIWNTCKIEVAIQWFQVFEMMQRIESIGSNILKREVNKKEFEI